jgi:hypothetical protein
MDATITNLSTERVFVPGPNLDLAATGDPDGDDVGTWPDVTIADLDGNQRIKELVVAGTISVDVVEDATDVAAAASGSVTMEMLPRYTVAQLAALTGVDGRAAFATDGRAGAEGAAAGTGTMVVYSNGEWRRVEDLAVVAA